jgi:hypothetical protein
MQKADRLGDVPARLLVKYQRQAGRENDLSVRLTVLHSSHERHTITDQFALSLVDGPPREHFTPLVGQGRRGPQRICRPVQARALYVLSVIITLGIQNAPFLYQANLCFRSYKHLYIWSGSLIWRCQGRV